MKVLTSSSDGSYTYDFHIDEDKYFDWLMRALLKEYKLIELAETIGPNGEQDVGIFVQLSEELQQAVYHLGTRASHVYLNGIHGRIWDDDLWYER